jgi:preprotein translocase subunit SecD
VGSALGVQNAFANTDENDKISVQAARAKEPTAAAEADSAAPKINDKEEKALLDRVLKSDAPAIAQAAPEKAVAPKAEAAKDTRDYHNEKNIFLDKPEAKVGNLAGGKRIGQACFSGRSFLGVRTRLQKILAGTCSISDR